MPEDYFNMAHAPIITIRAVNYDSLDLISVFMRESTNLEDNLFSNNRHFQVLTYSEHQFSASLVDYASNSYHNKLIIKANRVDNNYFIGPGSALFFINDGSSEVSGNFFQMNGLT